MSGHEPARVAAIPALTGLRIVGAGWVVLFHFQPTIYEALPAAHVLKPLLSHGHLGVPLFFALSGFIIWHNYGFRTLLTPRSTTRFLWRRFARLWPVNVATTLLSVPLIFWAVDTQGYWGAPIPEWFSPIGLLKSSFMVSQIGASDPVYAWNQPSWTLTGEMVAYVLFPLVLIVFITTRMTRFRGALCFALALLIACLVTDESVVFPYRWLANLLLIFIAGVLARLAGVPRSAAQRIASVAQIAAPIAIAIACYFDVENLLVILLVVWVWSLASDTGLGVLLFSTRFAQTAGLSSYSLYMTHWVAFGYFYILLFYQPELRQSFLIPSAVAMLVVVPIAAWAMWKFFETPTRKLLNSLFERTWQRPEPQIQAITVEVNNVASGDKIGHKDAPSGH